MKQENKITLHNRLDASIKALENVCDEHPNIKAFVDYLEVLFDKSLETTSEYKIAQQLCMFIWEINKSSIEGEIKYGAETGWINDLLQFIGNYFLDDAYFMVKKDGTWGCWEAYDTTNSSPGTQDARVLIEAAKDNVAFQQADEVRGTHERTEEQRIAYLKFLKAGMQSSGNVEKLLERNS